MTKEEKMQSAISRARGWIMPSTMNYHSIIAGFMEKGIPAEEITPRENVLTFWAWQAVGRKVKKGEHGVKCVTFIDAIKETDKVDEKTGDKVRRSYSRPWTTTVFHISQTEPINK